ncbi:MAG: TldD/PmbA family protein [Candidatus Latescibacterota bacterium]
MRDRMEQALKKSRADYTEIRLEEQAVSGLSFQGEELDHIGSSSSTGGMVRALVNGGWGVAAFNDLGDLEDKVAQAAASARWVGKEKSQWAEVPPVVDTVTAAMKEDFRQVPLAEKKAVVEAYNRIILGYHEKIQTTLVRYRDAFRRVRFANSEGAYIEEERPDLSAYLSAVARDGDNVQRTGEGVAGTTEGFGVVRGMEEQAMLAASRAVDLLDARPVQGGNYTVVLDPKLAGVFAHEAFGHLSEADFVYENERLKELMVLGKRFGPDWLNILDDGSIAGARGTHRYDDEGTKTRKSHLIKEGILVGRLHSRETAAKMGEEPTGNARALGYSNEPIVRMTNTYIDRGDATFEEMIRDVKLGVYALDMIGGQTDMEMFTFSAGYGYMIRDGQIAELVRDVTLTGNVFETLKNVDRIEREVVWSKGGGGCGKGGQSGLPVGIGSPHVRIRNVTIGGGQ